MQYFSLILEQLDSRLLVFFRIRTDMLFITAKSVQVPINKFSASVIKLTF